MITEHQSVPQVLEPAYYQRLYDIEEQNGWAQGMRDATVALLRRPLRGKRRLRVLDVGCGTGYLMGYLRRHYALDGEVVGIDVSAHALGFCRRRGASALALASAVELPFVSESFDLIICIDTLQHLSPAGADQAAISEFARLLRPGGTLYLRTNSALGHARLEGANPDLYRRYDLASVISMLESSGLEVVRATYLNALPGAWAMLRERFAGKVHTVAPIGPGLTIRPHTHRLRWLGTLVRAVLRFESWLVGTVGVDLPSGHSTAFVARRME